MQSTTFRQEASFWALMILFWLTLAGAVAGCAQLAEQFGMKEKPQSLLEQVAVAEASAQWMVKSLNDVATSTGTDAAEGLLDREVAKARVQRIRTMLCDLGLSDGSVPQGCPARQTPTARALIASAGSIAQVDPVTAEQKLATAQLTISQVRVFLRPYLVQKGG